MIDADTYSLYLYDDLFVPVASYFPGEEYPFLDSVPVTDGTPLVTYMQTHREAVHNHMPGVKELWASNKRSRLFSRNGLNYVLAAPMFYNGHWLGSLNMARRDAVFTDRDLAIAESAAKLIVLFFSNSEKLSVESYTGSGRAAPSRPAGIDLAGGESNSLKLSQREYEVMDLVSYGLTYNEISAQLFISVNTVKHHLKNVYRKMGINSKARLIRLLNSGKDIDFEERNKKEDL